MTSTSSTTCRSMSKSHWTTPSLRHLPVSSAHDFISLSPAVHGENSALAIPQGLVNQVLACMIGAKAGACSPLSGNTV